MRTARSVLVVSSVLAAVLSGCGSDKAAAPKLPTPTPVDTTGDPAFAKALDALSTATSFEAKTEPSPSLPAPTDIHFGQHGSSVSIHTGTVDLDIVSDGVNAYIKAPASFWSASLPGTTKNAQAAAATLATKWVKLDPSLPSLGNYSSFIDKSKFLAQLKQEDVHYALGGNDTVGGQQALILRGNNGSNWWVQPDGDGRPLKTSAGSNSLAQAQAGSMVFSGYNEPFTPTLPAASDVLDYKQATG